MTKLLKRKAFEDRLIQVSLRIDLINQYSDCICTKCKDYGCHVKLDRISNDHVVIRGTQFQKKRNYNDELCDFMVFDRASQNPIRLGLLELTKGDADNKGVKLLHKQIQNGASIADKMARNVEVSVFCPYLAKGKGASTMISKILARDEYLIQFRRSSPKAIRIVRCGSSLIFPS